MVCRSPRAARFGSRLRSHLSRPSRCCRRQASLPRRRRSSGASQTAGMDIGTARSESARSVHGTTRTRRLCLVAPISQPSPQLRRASSFGRGSHRIPTTGAFNPTSRDPRLAATTRPVLGDGSPVSPGRSRTGFVLQPRRRTATALWLRFLCERLERHLGNRLQYRWSRA